MSITVGKKNRVINFIYLIIAGFFYILTGFGTFFKQKTIILCYHGVTDAQKEKFKRQMKHLQTLRKCRNKNGLDVHLTFDDGFYNLIENAVPSLFSLKIPASILIVPGNYGKNPEWNIAQNHIDANERLMTEDEIKNIGSEMIKIGSHTQTHPKLSEVSGRKIEWELQESKNNLEALLGVSIEEIALPHGDYNQEVLDYAVKAGYKRIYTLEPRLNDNNQESKTFGRFSLSPDTGLMEFHFICCGSYFWLYPFRKVVNRLRVKNRIKA